MHQNLYLASTLDRYPCESKIYHASLLVFSIHIRQVHLWKQNASYFTNCTGIVLSTLDRYPCGSKVNHTSQPEFNIHNRQVHYGLWLNKDFVWTINYSPILLDVPTRYTVFLVSSPDPKGQVSYCHH